MQLLAEKRILSAPVWDEAQHKDVGFFDVLDFVGYLQDHGAAGAAAVFATEIVKLVSAFPSPLLPRPSLDRPDRGHCVQTTRVAIRC